MNGGENPFTGVKQVAAGIKEAGISLIVINAESGILKFGEMENLFEALGAKYLHLEDLKVSMIISIIRQIISR